MIRREACKGCHDDYYNQAGNSTTGRCWNAKDGRMKDRYETGTWTDPTSPGAFAKVRVPSCYNAPGRHFQDALPYFVNPQAVRDARKLPRAS